MQKFTLSVFCFIACITLGINSCKKAGCTNPIASNYNADAKEDDGSCTIPGCTDPNSIYYDANANQSNGTCYSPYGVFKVRENCIGGNYFYNIRVDSVTANHSSVKFVNFANVDINPVATISGRNISIALQKCFDGDGDSSFVSGSGFYRNDSIYMNYVFTPLPTASSDTCSMKAYR